MANDDETSYEYGSFMKFVESDGLYKDKIDKIYPRIKSGDVVTIELDLQYEITNWAGNLSFGVNENWYGILCKVGWDNWYRLCVELRDPGITVEIIDFYCYNDS